MMKLGTLGQLLDPDFQLLGRKLPSLNMKEKKILTTKDHLQSKNLVIVAFQQNQKGVHLGVLAVLQPQKRLLF